MEKICIVDLKRCPICKQNLLVESEQCQYCGIKIRRINKNKIKNKNHLRKICKYDLNGQIKNVYKNVYECYPEDSRKGTQKRKRVIEVCDKKSKQFDGYQWKYADDKEDIGKVPQAGSSKAIVQVNFDGNIMKEYLTLHETMKKLNYTYSTVSKACKKRRPPEGANFFLFYKNEFCDSVFKKAYSSYLKYKMKIEVYNEENLCIDTFNTYADAAEKLQVSAAAISNWCKGKYKPSGKYKGFTFKQIGFTDKTEDLQCSSCMKMNVEECVIEKENGVFKRKITELEDMNRKYKSQIIELKKEIEKLKRKYPSRQYRVDHRIKFMMPIDEFINEFVKTKEIAGACIYILTDENGKRYVGQSNRDDYARIAEHFDGSSKDKVYEAYLKNVKFYVEQVITGWKEINIFNLNDAETYFIAKYNSFDDGYNATRGNHQCNIGKIDKIK